LTSSLRHRLNLEDELKGFVGFSLHSAYSAWLEIK